MRVLLTAAGLAALAELVWLVDQWAALRVFRSTHVVYFLVDRNGVVLYVGSTNDVDRRLLEHCDDQEPGEWRKAIYDIVRVRHCRSLRQARRVERRMIRALVDGARVRMCKPVNNVALVARSPYPSPVRLGWLAAYWLNGRLWPACRWQGPNLGKAPQNAADSQRSPFPGHVRVVPDRQSPVANPVSTADSPKWAPLGALPPADPSAPDLTGGDTPTAPGPGPWAPLHLVASAEDEPAMDKEAKRRADNARYQRERRARLAAQKRAAE